MTNPALQNDPLLQLNVTDADSTVNAEIIYIRTNYTEEYVGISYTILSDDIKKICLSTKYYVHLYI